MSLRVKLKSVFHRLDSFLTRDGFVDGAGGLLGIAAMAIGVSMVVAPALFARSGAWHYVFEAAQPWFWALGLIPCGLVMFIAASLSDIHEKKIATVPALVLTVIFMLLGVLLTLAGSPVGVIAFGTFSTLTAMVFRVYIREQARTHVSAP